MYCTYALEFLSFCWGIRTYCLTSTTSSGFSDFRKHRDWFQWSEHLLTGRQMIVRPGSLGVGSVGTYSVLNFLFAKHLGSVTSHGLSLLLHYKVSKSILWKYYIIIIFPFQFDPEYFSIEYESGSASESKLNMTQNDIQGMQIGAIVLLVCWCQHKLKAFVAKNYTFFQTRKLVKLLFNSKFLILSWSLFETLPDWYSISLLEEYSGSNWSCHVLEDWTIHTSQCKILSFADVQAALP